MPCTTNKKGGGLVTKNDKKKKTPGRCRPGLGGGKKEKSRGGGGGVNPPVHDSGRGGGGDSETFVRKSPSLRSRGGGKEKYRTGRSECFCWRDRVGGGRESLVWEGGKKAPREGSGGHEKIFFQEEGLTLGKKEGGNKN